MFYISYTILKLEYKHIHNHKNVNMPSHQKTCINDIKCDFLFLHTSCISNCAEQMLNISCRYLVYLLRYEHLIVNTIVKFGR